MERIDNRYTLISRSDERQKICWIVAMRIRGNILWELGGLCCWWNAYHQNLDMIDEMKHLPGAWIWKKRFTIVLFAIWRRPEVCCLCLVTAAENVSVQVRKTCLLQKRLPLSAVKAMVLFHIRCDRWCFFLCPLLPCAFYAGYDLIIYFIFNFFLTDHRSLIPSPRFPVNLEVFRIEVITCSKIITLSRDRIHRPTCSLGFLFHGQYQCCK